MARGSLTAAGCMTSKDALRMRHGSPLSNPACNNGKTFMFRQIISGHLQVTASGRTRDITDGDGNLMPGGLRLDPRGEAMRLTGMPGSLHETCVIYNKSAR